MSCKHAVRACCAVLIVGVHSGLGLYRESHGAAFDTDSWLAEPVMSVLGKPNVKKSFKKMAEDGTFIQ